jgi:hypothetical protein
MPFRRIRHRKKSFADSSGGLRGRAPYGGASDDQPVALTIYPLEFACVKIYDLSVRPLGTTHGQQCCNFGPENRLEICRVAKTHRKISPHSRLLRRDGVDGPSREKRFLRAVRAELAEMVGEPTPA